MSGPLLFFMFIIVGDLILKSLRDKKKIEKSKEERQSDLQGKPDVNKRKPMEQQGQKQMEKPGSIREMMSTLREEVEKERLRGIEKRQVKPKPKEVVKTNIEENQIEKKAYEDNQYWEDKRNRENNKKEIEMDRNVEKVGIDIREDLVKGFIFSEILAQPKSIQNQKRRM